jgi:hypothetical protein
MIDYIEFVEIDKYLGLGVPVADGGNLPALSSFPSYPGEYDILGREKIPYYSPDQSYNQYTKIFDFEYFSKTNIHDSGFFAQAPCSCSFILNSDSFLINSIIDPIGDKNSKYSRYVVRIFEDSVNIFDGLIVLDQLEYDAEKETVKITAFDFLVLLEDIKEIELNGKEWKFGNFLTQVINTNEFCLKFILSFAFHNYFNESADGSLPDEDNFYEIDVADIINSKFNFEYENSGHAVTCILGEETVYSLFSDPINGFIDIINWELLGFANLAEVRGYLLFVKWAYNTDLEKYSIRVEGYDYANNVISKYYSISQLDDFENYMKALGFKEPSTDNYKYQKFTLLGEEYRTPGTDNDFDFYGYLDEENKKITALRFDTKYYVLNKVYYWDIGALPVPAWVYAEFYDYKYLYVPTFNFIPLETAYATGLRLQSDSASITRFLAYDASVNRIDTLEFPLNDGKFFKCDIEPADGFAYFALKRVYEPAGANYVVYDLRSFIYMYAYSYYSQKSGIKLVYDKYFAWRHRTLLKVSGGIVISSIVSYEIAEDLDQNNPNFFTNPVVTEGYVDANGNNWGFLLQSETYEDLDTAQYYYGICKIENNIDPEATFVGDITIKTVNEAYLSGYTFSNYMSWQIDASLNITTLLKGILNFNNSSIRCLINNVYFEGRSNADITTGATLSEDDLIDLKYDRILEEIPDIQYLDNINQSDRDRLTSLIQNFYKNLFGIIKIKVTFDISEIFNTYNLDINDIVSIGDYLFKINKITKVADNIYNIEAWNIPFTVYSILKAGDSDIYTYGIRKDGELDVYDYLMKGI